MSRRKRVSASDWASIGAVGDAGFEVNREFSRLLEARSKGPDHGPLITEFFRSERQTLLEQLSFLVESNFASPRIALFERDRVERSTVHPLPDTDPTWEFVAASYAPAENTRGDSERLRGMLRTALNRAGPGEDALAMWILPHRGLRAALVCILTSTGEEAIFEFVYGELHRASTRHLREELERFSFATSDDIARLTRGEREHALRSELVDALDMPERSNNELADAVLAWLAKSHTFASVIEELLVAHIDPVVEEAHQWLCTSIRVRSEVMEESRMQQRLAFAAMEAMSERRVKGRRGDSDKHQLLLDGMKSRADRVESENQALTRKVAELESQLARGTTSHDARTEVAPSADTIRQALDSIF